VEVLDYAQHLISDISIAPTATTDSCHSPPPAVTQPWVWTVDLVSFYSLTQLRLSTGASSLCSIHPESPRKKNRETRARHYSLRSILTNFFESQTCQINCEILYGWHCHFLTTLRSPMVAGRPLHSPMRI
jgi:hypothetical protein